MASDLGQQDLDSGNLRVPGEDVRVPGKPVAGVPVCGVGQVALGPGGFVEPERGPDELVVVAIVGAKRGRLRYSK